VAQEKKERTNFKTKFYKQLLDEQPLDEQLPDDV
jgi:hypothetical protein